MKTKADIQAACRRALEEQRLFAFHPDRTVRYHGTGQGRGLCCAIGAAYSPEDGLDDLIQGRMPSDYTIDHLNPRLPEHLQVDPAALPWAVNLQIAHDNWAALEHASEARHLFEQALNA